ncbi:MAG: cupin domain-containing protein [Dehalococcoidia bacterium]
MTFFDPSQLTPRTLAPGAQIRTMWGEKIMISLAELEPASQIPAHSHPHEQMGMVLEGAITIVVGGESRDLKAGEVFLVPSNVEHIVTTGNVPTRVLDIFSPPREDFM